MSVFNINYERLITLLLPTRLRGATIQDLLKAFLKPFQILFNQFISYREATIITLTHTGQVMYIEHILNDTYDEDQRRIHIDDGDEYRYPEFLYNYSEGQQALELNNYDNGQIEMNNAIEFNLINDFVVKIPATLPSDDNAIREMVNRYKQAGKRFKIERI